MVKEFCDLCGIDVTETQSGAIRAGDDCDANGEGAVTDCWDIVCPRCYEKFKAFMVSLKKPKP